MEVVLQEQPLLHPLLSLGGHYDMSGLLIFKMIHFNVLILLFSFDPRSSKCWPRANPGQCPCKKSGIRSPSYCVLRWVSPPRWAVISSCGVGIPRRFVLASTTGPPSTTSNKILQKKTPFKLNEDHEHLTLLLNLLASLHFWGSLQIFGGFP